MLASVWMITLMLSSSWVITFISPAKWCSSEAKWKYWCKMMQNNAKKSSTKRCENLRNGSYYASRSEITKKKLRKRNGRTLIQQPPLSHKRKPSTADGGCTIFANCTQPSVMIKSSKIHAGFPLYVFLSLWSLLFCNGREWHKAPYHHDSLTLYCKLVHFVF